MVNIVFVVLILVGGAIGYGAFVEHFPADQRALGMQEAHSPVMERIADLHDMLLIMCFAISLFIVALLAYVAVRYNKKTNPVPSKVTHNTPLEIIWTIIPVIILVAISIPSIKLLYYMDKSVDADMTLKVIGYQWYWGYEYPDNDDIMFESYMLMDDELEEGQLRLLETDNRVVLPVDTDIRILLTSSDVIHAWAVPQLGVKIDAVPGRLNETWLRIDKPGVYRGQCSELCGVNHGFMPVVIEAVSKEDFEKWVEEAKEEFAANDNSLEPKNIKLSLLNE